MVSGGLTHRVYIMRHGPAEEHSASGRDADRSLTPSGKARVRDVAGTLAAKGERPERIVTSPLVRARQTADIVAEVLGLHAALDLSNQLAPSGDPLRLVVETFRAAPDREAATLFIGHEPALSMLIALLVGRGPAHGLQQSMIVAVDLALADSERGYEASLRFVLEPKTLTWLHG